jgi:NAD(P)-dependent dehydrogenase (short-subunit alcohol dehydrogenase family)
MKEKFGNNVPVKFYQVDITNENQVKQWIESTINHFGNIDILVNNAAAFIFGTVEEASSEDWDRVFNVNVKGYALCSKYAIPHMKKNGKGSIIHIGSQSGFIAQPKFTPYNSSKGAILQLTRCMAMDYGEFNIRVNCICPGTIDTPATSEHAKKLGISKEELVKITIKDHFLKKLGSVDDVAYAVLFFASDESSFITGTSLLIDGGNTAH